MQIMKNLSREDYDQIDALNASRLALLLKSPRHYQMNYFKESDAMKLGTAIHMAYLEPKNFKDKYVVEPQQVLCLPRDEKGKVIKGAEPVWQAMNKRLKDHKEYLANWRASQEKLGSIVITDDEMGSITGVLNSISEEIRFPPPRDCISVQELLATKDTEVTAVNEFNGIQVKARADLLVNTRLGRTIVDIKKTSAISPEDFVNKVYKYHYDLQAAFYMHAFEAEAFVWLCVESDEPYAVATYNAQHFLEIGRKKIDKCLEIKARCESENYWPWFSRGVEDLMPTAWQVKLHMDEAI